MSLYFTWDLPYTLPSSLPLISSIALASKTLSSLMQNKTLNPAFPSTNLFLQVPQKLQSFWKSGLGRSHYFCLIFKPPSQTHLLPRPRETALHRNRKTTLHKNRETPSTKTRRQFIFFLLRPRWEYVIGASSCRAYQIKLMLSLIISIYPFIIC